MKQSLCSSNHKLAYLKGFVFTLSTKRGPLRLAQMLLMLRHTWIPYVNALYTKCCCEQLPHYLWAVM